MLKSFLSGFCLILSCLTLFGCDQEPTSSSKKIEIPKFDGQRAFDEVVELVKISPRDAGTPGARKAAEHIARRLKENGVTNEIVTFDDSTPEGNKTFHNVVGRIPGKTDRWIILGSHFDTMPGIENFQGANDSGSSTGILIEMARTLAKTELNKGIIFAFFDGEEGIANYIPGDGLHGSRYMANQMYKSGELDQIDAMVLLDMVGDKDLNFTIPANSTRKLVNELLNAARDAGHRHLFRLGASNMMITDDHQPFYEMNVPAINIIDFNFGSAPGLNDHWHTPDDNIESISAESLSITGDVTLHLLFRLMF